MNWRDRYFPNRPRPGSELFFLCMATLAAGVLQAIGGLMAVIFA